MVLTSRWWTSSDLEDSRPPPRYVLLLLLLLLKWLRLSLGKKTRASEDAELGEDNINYRDSPHILHGNPNYKQAPHAPKTIHLAPPQPILLRPLPYYRPIAPQKCFPTLSRKWPSKIEILLLHTKYYAPFWWKKTNLATKFIQQPPPTRAWGSVQSA